MDTLEGLPEPRRAIGRWLAAASVFLFAFACVSGSLLSSLDGMVGTTLREFSRYAFAVVFVCTGLGFVAGLWAREQLQVSALVGWRSVGWSRIAQIFTWANMATLLGLAVAVTLHWTSAI